MYFFGHFIIERWVPLRL
jgi:hypothetical protein